MTILNKALAAAVVCVTFAALAAPADAQVRRRGVNGGAVAAGVLGGLVAGALIAGAARPARAAPVYDAPVLEDEPFCRRRHIGYDAYGRAVYREYCR